MLDLLYCLCLYYADLQDLSDILCMGLRFLQRSSVLLSYKAPKDLQSVHVSLQESLQRHLSPGFSPNHSISILNKQTSLM